MNLLKKCKTVAFVLLGAAVALVSCKEESDVQDVCSDMVKTSMHKSTRSLLEEDKDAQKLTVSEYEFLGNVDDNRMVYRIMTWGNGVFEAKHVDTLTYEYGQWAPDNTSFTLIVTPANDAPFTLTYSGNAFIEPNGRTFGGPSTDNIARVEKWESVLATLPNSEWEGTFRDEYEADSIYEDSLYIRPIVFITDTIKVFKGKMDTLNADTTCYYKITLNRDETTLANTCHFYQKQVRSKYNRETGEADVLEEHIKEYDGTWYFSAVSSDKRFVLVLVSSTPDVEGNTLSISQYKLDAAGNPDEFLLGGVTYRHPVVP